MRDSMKAVLVGLLFVALAVPPATSAAPGIPLPEQQASGLEMAPRAASWSYITSGSRSEPPMERSASPVCKTAVPLFDSVQTDSVWYVQPPTELPAGYRLIYLLPVFNSKYK